MSDASARHVSPLADVDGTDGQRRSRIVRGSSLFSWYFPSSHVSRDRTVNFPGRVACAQNSKRPRRVSRVGPLPLVASGDLLAAGVDEEQLQRPVAAVGPHPVAVAVALAALLEGRVAGVDRAGRTDVLERVQLILGVGQRGRRRRDRQRTCGQHGGRKAPSSRHPGVRHGSLLHRADPGSFSYSQYVNAPDRTGSRQSGVTCAASRPRSGRAGQGWGSQAGPDSSCRHQP